MPEKSPVQLWDMARTALVKPRLPKRLRWVVANFGTEALAVAIFNEAIYRMYPGDPKAEIGRLISIGNAMFFSAVNAGKAAAEVQVEAAGQEAAWSTVGPIAMLVGAVAVLNTEHGWSMTKSGMGKLMGMMGLAKTFGDAVGNVALGPSRRKAAMTGTAVTIGIAVAQWAGGTIGVLAGLLIPLFKYLLEAAYENPVAMFVVKVVFFGTLVQMLLVAVAANMAAFAEGSAPDSFEMPPTGPARLVYQAGAEFGLEMCKAVLGLPEVRRLSINAAVAGALGLSNQLHLSRLGLGRPYGLQYQAGKGAEDRAIQQLYRGNSRILDRVDVRQGTMARDVASRGLAKNASHAPSDAEIDAVFGFARDTDLTEAPAESPLVWVAADEFMTATGRAWKDYETKTSGLFGLGAAESGARGFALDLGAAYDALCPVNDMIQFVTTTSFGNLTTASLDAGDALRHVFGVARGKSSITRKWQWENKPAPQVLGRLDEDVIVEALAGLAEYMPDPDPLHPADRAFGWKVAFGLCTLLARALIYRSGQSLFGSSASTVTATITSLDGVHKAENITCNALLLETWNQVYDLIRGDRATLTEYVRARIQSRFGATGVQRFAGDRVARALEWTGFVRPFVAEEDLEPTVKLISDTLFKLTNDLNTPSSFRQNIGYVLKPSDHPTFGAAGFALYCIIDEHKRGTLDCNLADLYEQFIFVGVPGQCKICKKRPAALKWAFEGRGETFASWMCPVPGSQACGPDDMRQAFALFGNGRMGCASCFVDEMKAKHHDAPAQAVAAYETLLRNMENGDIPQGYRNAINAYRGAGEFERREARGTVMGESDDFTAAQFADELARLAGQAMAAEQARRRGRAMVLVDDWD